MKNGIVRIDNLLDNLALSLLSSYSSNVHHQLAIQRRIPPNEMEGLKLVESKSVLESLSLPFQTGADVESFQTEILINLQGGICSLNDNGNTTIASRLGNNKLSIPISLLMQHIEDYSLHVPSADEIKDNLFTYNTIITIHQICNTCFAIPCVDKAYYYNQNEIGVDDNNINPTSSDNITFWDLNELHKLKEKHIVKWNKTISNIQFQKLNQQIFQVVSDLDLQLEKCTIDKLAEQIL